MRDMDVLLDRLEGFVNTAVELPSTALNADALAARMDVLERAIELLRIRTGRFTNSLSMEKFLEYDIRAVQNDSGTQLQLARVDRKTVSSIVTRLDHHSQGELQGPLLSLLLHQTAKEARISDVLSHLLEKIRTQLLPGDVESTRTGVPRIVTTIRTAARSLRLHGLLSESGRSRYRTWEVSVLGAIVGATVYPTLTVLPLPPAGTAGCVVGPYGSSTALTKNIGDALLRLRKPEEAAKILATIFLNEKEVFDSFAQAAAIIEGFCQQFAPDVAHSKRPRLNIAAGQQIVSDQLGRLRKSLEPLKVRDEISRSLAIRRLLE